LNRIYCFFTENPNSFRLERSVIVKISKKVWFISIWIVCWQWRS